MMIICKIHSALDLGSIRTRNYELCELYNIPYLTKLFSSLKNSHSDNAVLLSTLVFQLIEGKNGEHFGGEDVCRHEQLPTARIESAVESIAQSHVLLPILILQRDWAAFSRQAKSSCKQISIDSMGFLNNSFSSQNSPVFFWKYFLHVSLQKFSWFHRKTSREGVNWVIHWMFTREEIWLSVGHCRFRQRHGPSALVSALLHYQRVHTSKYSIIFS